MLTFEEIYATLPSTGWLYESEARLLWESINSTQGDILEVGSYHGRSTVLLAATGRAVHAVDPFDNFDSDDPTGDSTYKKFMDNVFHSRCLMNVHLHRKKVEEWFPTTRFGFAYLDGDHTYEGTLLQIEKATDVGAKVCCIHDYAQTGGGVNVVKAIERAGLTVVRVVERMAWCRCLE